MGDFDGFYRWFTGEDCTTESPKGKALKAEHKAEVVHDDQEVRAESPHFERIGRGGKKKKNKMHTQPKYTIQYGGLVHYHDERSGTHFKCVCPSPCYIHQGTVIVDANRTKLE